MDRNQINGSQRMRERKRRNGSFMVMLFYAVMKMI
jgi:hypothetical protein